MSRTLKRGDDVQWNSEAGRVRGIILKKITSDIRIQGYVHHASKNQPEYLIQSDQTDHVAIHKGPALRLLKPRSNKKRVRRVRRKRG